MSASILSTTGSPLRSLEWLAGPSALLSSTALTTAQLAELGPIVPTVEGAADPGSTDAGTSPLPEALTGPANQAILDTHMSLEDVGHQNPSINGPIHGLTGLGETVGLGHLGESGTLLTDLSTLPGSVAGGGGLASADPILTDAGHVLGAADSLTTSVTNATQAGNLLNSSPLGPVTTLANTGLNDIGTTLNDVGHGLGPLNDPIQDITHLGETAGLGHLGQGGNLLTDTAALPGDLLSGHGLSSLSPILGDIGQVAGAADTLTGSVAGLGALGTGAVNAVGQVVGQVVGQTVGDVGHALDGATSAAGLVGQTVGQAAGDVGHTVDGASGLVSSLTGTAGSLLGDAAGTGTGGTHPLVDVSAGPATSTPLADIGVLSPGGQPSHTVEVSAGSAQASQPDLLHAALLSGDGIAFPQAGQGADSLVGHLQDIAPTASTPIDGGTSDHLGADLGLVSVDLGGHAHAAQTDPTPHTATTGTHLLGL